MWYTMKNDKTCKHMHLKTIYMQQKNIKYRHMEYILKITKYAK